MKVLLISGAYPPMCSGEATNTYYLAEQLASRGLDVHVLTSRLSNIPQLEGVSVSPIMNRWSWGEASKFSRFLKDYQPSAVLLIYQRDMYQNRSMMTFAPTLAKKVLPNVPFVTRFESMSGSPLSNTFTTRVLRKVTAHWMGPTDVHYTYGTLLRDSDRVIVLSAEQLRFLQRECAGIDRKALLIPPPANVAVVHDETGSLRRRGRARLGFNKDHFVVGYLGYIYPGKGIDALIKSVARVHGKREGVRLMVLGGMLRLPRDIDAARIRRYFDDVQALATELSISDKITWTGDFSIGDADTARYIHAADLFVLPFDRGVHLNNSSFSVLASYGAPVIATQGDDLDEAFVHGQNVWLCHPRESEELARAIEFLMDHPDVARRLRCGVEEMAREWFSWDGALDRTLQALDSRWSQPNSSEPTGRRQVGGHPMIAAAKQ